MATSQAATSNMKRQRPDDEQQHLDKIQRLNSTDESVRTTKIIGLNDDCLVKIFNLLDLSGLFNVAIANEWLRPAARDVYKRKFGKKLVEISGCDDFIPEMQANASNRQHSKFSWLKPSLYHIEITGLKTTLQYLRCFGESIDELKINYSTSKSKRYGHVHQYINDYCAENLKGISFEQMPNITINQFQSDFAEVEHIRFLSSDFGKQLPSIIECFPNVGQLKFVHATLVFDAVVRPLAVEPFQHLKKLTLDGINGFASYQNLLQLVKRQLQCLDIRLRGDQTTMNVFLDLIKENSSIIDLSMWCYQLMPVNLGEVHRLATEHSALVRLYLPEFLLSAENAIVLIHRLNSLKQLTFQANLSEYANLKASLLNSEWNVSDLDDGADRYAANGHFAITSVTLYRRTK